MGTALNTEKQAASGKALAGKTAVVTGSTSGIGLSIAKALANAGARVMLNGLGDSAAIAAVKQQVGELNANQVAFNDADMTDPAAIVGLIEATVKQFGAVDILVNNAGIQHTSPVEQFPVDKWDAILAINLSSSFHTIRAALPHMRTNDWGRIINIASVHGLVASEHKAAYVAAKHGLVGLTKVVALETAATNITCNAVCPGWVRTPLVEKQIDALGEREQLSADAAAVKLLSEKQPSGRFVEVEQLAGLVLFLCSPAASAITGTALPIDGGWLAR